MKFHALLRSIWAMLGGTTGDKRGAEHPYDDHDVSPRVDIWEKRKRDVQTVGSAMLGMLYVHCNSVGRPPRDVHHTIRRSDIEYPGTPSQLEHGQNFERREERR